MAVVLGVSGIVDAVEVAFRLGVHPCGPLVDLGQAAVDIEVLRARQTRGAEEVHLGDVHVLQVLDGHLEEFVDA